MAVFLLEGGFRFGGIMGKYVLAAVIIILAFMMWRKSKYLKHVFSDAHYFEVAEVLHELKGPAVKRLVGTDDGSVDGKVTSAGLALSYSISEEGGQFEHHVAVSMTNRPTLHAIADRYIYYSIWVLGLPLICWTARTPQDVRKAKRWTDQMTFGRIRP